MSKRKIRDKIEVSEAEMLKPLDIEKFGSKNDPCFGKLYNLGTKECKRCGDSEICGSVFSQYLNKERKNIESTTRFKDIELSPAQRDVHNYIKKLKKKDYKDSKVIRLVKRMFRLNRDEVLKYMNNG